MGAVLPEGLELGGQALLLRAARAFEAAPSVEGIIAVVPEPAIEEARALLEAVAGLLAVVAGGARRQDSVLEGLSRCPTALAASCSSTTPRAPSWRWT